MRRVAPLIALILLAGCGGGSAGFYDGNAENVAKEAAVRRLQPKREKLTAESIRERSDCPQAPSSNAGPCLNVELNAEGKARPFRGGDPVATVKETIDAFVWLDKNGERWKVRYVTYRPRDVSVNGVPYQPSP